MAGSTDATTHLPQFYDITLVIQLQKSALAITEKLRESFLFHDFLYAHDMPSYFYTTYRVGILSK